MLYFSTFLEGLLSFFSPCILPLLPVYLGILSGSENKSRKKTFIMTLGFCLGISTIFFFFAFVSSSLSTVFRKNQAIFQIIAGIILIIVALFQFNVFKINTSSALISKVNERISKLTKDNLTFFSSFLLGLLITITWSPCIGPMLGATIAQLSASGSSMQAFIGVCCYTLGFILIFLILGLFTNEVLNFLKKHRNIVKYTKIISSLVILGMGVYLLYSGIRDVQHQREGQMIAEANCCGMSKTTEERELSTEGFDFTLRDMNDDIVTLSQNTGKPIILSFSATWCPYCKVEWEHFSELAKTGDYQIYVVMIPNNGNELDEAGIREFISSKDYAFDVLYDNDMSVNIAYQVMGYPTTFFFNSKGELITYTPGYVDEVTLNEILDYVAETETQ